MATETDSFLNRVLRVFSCCQRRDNPPRFYSSYTKSGHTNLGLDHHCNDHFTLYGLEYRETDWKTVSQQVSQRVPVPTFGIHRNDATNIKAKTWDSGCGHSIGDSLPSTTAFKSCADDLSRKDSLNDFKECDGMPRRNMKVHRKVKSVANGVALGCHSKRISPSDFEFLSVIGKGSFGRVMLARRRKNRKIYAIKVLDKKMITKRNETAHVLSERSVLIKVMKHPFLVTLHYAFTTDTQIFFVLDYVNGGELFYHLQRDRVFSERRAKFYAAEICCAFSYMHSKGIIYRDLKPENILLDKEGHVILTDFGLCKEGLESADSRTSTFCGTPEYLAPEIILKKAYTRSVDWWTLGAVLYEMLYGLPPFYSKNTKAMYHSILNKAVRLRPTATFQARDLLSELLNKNPARRLGSGTKDGMEVRSHVFFSDIKWNLIQRRQVKPPYIPLVMSESDTRNIDPSFTREPFSVPSNICTGILADDQEDFKNFSYTPPEHFFQDG